jgi:hypothetical protein
VNASSCLCLCIFTPLFVPRLQTIQAKDGEDGPDDAEPLSAVQLALRSQLAKGPALPQPAGDNGTAAVAAASHGHLHMPFFEKVDIGK